MLLMLFLQFIFRFSSSVLRDSVLVSHCEKKAVIFLSVKMTPNHHSVCNFS